MAKPGDRVSIATDDATLQGTLMPGDGACTVLKLDNGYNIGILNNRINHIRVLHTYKKQEAASKGHTHTPNLPLITILHTGGTIASKVDYETGGAYPHFTPQDIINMFPELGSLANIESRLVRSMYSEDMRFAHYNLLAKEIEKEIKAGAKGVIIAHGTDTLHHTAAALSFMIRPCPIPVILVGAQRSSDRGSSDAATNLISAATFITKADFGGIAVCMHETMSDDSCVILPGTQCRKVHSTRRDAFKAVNSTPLARINPFSGRVDILKKMPARTNDKAVITFMEEKLRIGVLYAHPNMHADELKNYDGYDGLLILGTGIGNLPINTIDNETKEHTRIYNSLKQLIKKGTVVAMAVQTIWGGVHHNVYTTGRRLAEAGVLGNGTFIAPDTAFIKLAWLLSNHKSHAAEHWNQNMAGELDCGSPDGAPW